MVQPLGTLQWVSLTCLYLYPVHCMQSNMHFPKHMPDLVQRCMHHSHHVVPLWGSLKKVTVVVVVVVVVVGFHGSSFSSRTDAM